jgi:hypothetical protein
MAVTRLSNRARWGFALLAALGTWLALAPAAIAQSTIQIQSMRGEIYQTADGPKPFVLEGEAAGLGRFAAIGEVMFRAGAAAGSVVGTGPVVFRADNGDLLVGVATWEIGRPVGGLSNTQFRVTTRDVVEFSDGTVVGSTGQFEDDRPVGVCPLPTPAIVIVTRTVIDTVTDVVTTVVDTIKKL